MQKISFIFITSLLVSSISGCSNFKFPWVYQLRIQQGSYIEQDMINQLEKGMSKSQVQYVMGTPIIQDTFNTDRWDYYFNIKRGGDTIKEYHYIMQFEDSKLLSWNGTYETTADIKKQEQEEVLEQTKSNDDRRF